MIQTTTKKTMQFVPKHTQKFNSLLLMFLSDLAQSVPQQAIVQQARDFLNALIALDPANTSVLEQFMSALRYCSDFIAARNTDLFSKASDVNKLITKEDVITIYRELTENDRVVVWRYLERLFATGRKACPSYDVEREFDFANLSPSSPLHGLIKTAREQLNTGACTTSALTTTTGANEPNMMVDAFRKTCTAYLTSINDNTTDSALKALLQQGIAVIADTEINDTECQMLAQAFSMNFQHVDDVQGLVLDTEKTLRTFGLPLVAGGAATAAAVLDAAPDKESIVNSALQAATMFLTLSSLDAATLNALQNLTQKFCAEVQQGNIEIGENPSVLSLMSSLSMSSLSGDVLALIASMGGGEQQ